MSSDDPRATRERIKIALDAFDDGWAKGFAAAEAEFRARLSSLATVEAVKAALSEWETFRAGDGHLSVGMRDKRSDEETARDVLAAVRSAMTGGTGNG